MERTTIMLDKPLLDRIRQRAQKEHKTLKETLNEIILQGLRRNVLVKAEKLDLPTLNLGREKADISNRTKLYEMLEDEK